MQQTDDFFSEEESPKEEAATQNNSENSSLPPSNDEKPPKKWDKKKVWLRILSIGIAVFCFVLGLGVSPLLMDEEMRSLMLLKRKIQNEYYYEITNEEFYGAIFDTINEQLLDPYSSYMTKEEYQIEKTQSAGNYNGTGIVYRVNATADAEDVYVSYTRGNSSGESAGLLRGDKIVAFGDTQDDLTTLNNYDQLKTFISSQPKDELFYLQCERAGVKQTVAVSNAPFAENYVFYRTGDTSYTFAGEQALTLTQGNDPIVGLPSDTAYIRLTKFYGSSATQFAAAMNLFKKQGKKHLIVDLRYNGGGYMNTMTQIAAYFCKGQGSFPTVAVAENKYGHKQSYSATKNLYGDYFSEDSQIYLLADSGSASASECLIGCMVDYGALSLQNICLMEENGVAKTYGKGIMQTTYTFGLFYPDAVRLTTATIKWPVSGKCIHGVGLTPTDGCKTTPAVFDKDGEVYGGLTALGVL